MDKIELPPYLQSIKSLDAKFCYDKYNILYLIIKHLFPKMAHIKDYKKSLINIYENLILKTFFSRFVSMIWENF